jgi:hypothetical protein
MATTDDADVEIARRHAARMYASRRGVARSESPWRRGPGKATARMRVLPSMVRVAFIRPVVAGKELTAAATERLKNARNASTTSPCSAEIATWWPSCAGTGEHFPSKRRDAGSI